MGKRKIFMKTDLATARIEYTRDNDGQVVISPEVIPPINTVVSFPKSAMKLRRFDFGPWYGMAIDSVTYACQRQIERFLDKQDSDVEVSTVTSYCSSGLRSFLDYLVMLSAALRRPLTLSDITRDTVDGFLRFLRDKGISATSQQTTYNYAKSVLVALGRRSLIDVVHTGDDATFPANPFPGSHRGNKGESPLPTVQRKAFTAAVKTAVLPLLTSDAEPTGEMLAYAFLIVALHTGRNNAPLIEMPTDCLRAHPKDGIEFLVLYKRRGHTTNKVALRAQSAVDRFVEATPTLRPTVGYTGDMVRDVMLQAVESRFQGALKTDSEIEWLSDNGSCSIADETLTFSRAIGLKPVTTPVRSPQSNGMAESFVKTMKRDYVSWMPKPDARTALQNLAIAFDHYNESHPHSALKYRSPREFRQQANSLT